jgi:hypothetical protein
VGRFKRELLANDGHGEGIDLVPPATESLRNGVLREATVGEEASHIGIEMIGLVCTIGVGDRRLGNSTSLFG